MGFVRLYTCSSRMGIRVCDSQPSYPSSPPLKREYVVKDAHTASKHIFVGHYYRLERHAGSQVSTKLMAPRFHRERQLQTVQSQTSASKGNKKRRELKCVSVTHTKTLVTRGAEDVGKLKTATNFLPPSEWRRTRRGNHRGTLSIMQ